jgi:hypothetical protein
MEIALDDTPVQPRIVRKIQCSKRCDGDTYINDQHYCIFRAPKFVFVTLETGSAEAMNLQIQQPMYRKSNLIQKSFSYRLDHFIIITKDEHTFIKQNPDNTYLALNHVTKLYEPLFGCHFQDFIAAAAADIVLCYATDDIIIGSQFMDDWTRSRQRCSRACFA